MGGDVDEPGTCRIGGGGRDGDGSPDLVLRTHSMDERRGEGVGRFVRQLVVDPDSVIEDVDHAGANDEGRTEQLLAVVAGVDVHRSERDALGNAQRVQDRRGSGGGIDAVEADVHVTEVVDLVLGDGASVGDGQCGGRCVVDGPILSELDRPRQLTQRVSGSCGRGDRGVRRCRCRSSGSAHRRPRWRGIPRRVGGSAGRRPGGRRA